MNLKSKKYNLLAVDIGASGGKIYLSDSLNSDMVECYRFNNQMKESSTGAVWDLDYLWTKIIKGLKVGTSKYDIKSIGLDMWGVDYVLMKNDEPVQPAFAYRNNRTETIIKNVHELIPFNELYEITGTQFQPFNTIYQLYHDKISGRLDNVDQVLMLPEYFIWKLTGEKINEFTNATTTGLVDFATGRYSSKILSKLGVSEHIFKNLVKPGKQIELSEHIKSELDTNANFVVTATHDTASAVEAIPINEGDAFLSSGTWSLIGVKVQKPIISKKAIEQNFSNEGGIGYYRFQKNIMGLWIIQELMREYKVNSFSHLVENAKKSRVTEVFPINDIRFLSPSSMKDEIKSYFDNLGVKDLEEEDLFNTTFYSLAHSYKVAIKELTEITEKEITSLHIFGGGARNEYLNNIVIDMLDIDVVVHPIEASVIGNLKIQKGIINNEKKCN